MPKWYVELYVGQDILYIGGPYVREDDQTVLAFLSTCLQDPSFAIVGNNNYRYLVSTDLDTFDSEDDVYQYARNQFLPILNGAMQIKFYSDICEIKIGDIYHRNEDGYLTRTVMRTTFTGSSFPPEDFLQSTNVQHPSIAEILIMAKSNPLVAEALQDLATSHSWYSLVKIFEIIADYTGQAENSGKLPRGTFDKWTQGRDFGKHPPGKSFDFLQTAHSYYWSGLNARHSSVKSGKRTGANPMTINDAIEYITGVLLKWLQTHP